MLADAPGALPALERLVVSSYVCPDVPLAVLADMHAPLRPWLEVSCGSDPHGLEPLLRAPFLSQLRGLRLSLDIDCEAGSRFVADPGSRGCEGSRSTGCGWMEKISRCSGRTRMCWRG